jgi:hypothetical protein
MIHGAAQTGSNFIATPDGQPGWAQFFVANGYAVYIADQVGRGRSNYALEPYNAFGPPFDVLSRQKNWSLQQEYKFFPRGYMHTQWPGTGLEGDPFFDQYYASQVQWSRMGSGRKPWHKQRALRCSIGSVRRSSSRTPSPEPSDFSSRISGRTW